jgi:hypothetical protein
MFGVPLKFKRDIVPWFVTPCGILPQHDQTDPFSYHMEGKSELAITHLIVMTSTFVFEQSLKVDRKTWFLSSMPSV